MSFRRIEYLEWARAYMGRVRYDLAKSNIKALTTEELGLQLGDVELTGSREDRCDELYDLLATRYGVARENVFVSNGATQGIYLACAAIVDRGGNVLLESPNYEPLRQVPAQLGAEVSLLERRFEQNFQIDLEEIERRVGKSTQALILTNLHNPSMAATNVEKMTTLGQILRDVNGYVIVSEVYLDSALREGLKPAAALGRNLISLGSLSKVYGLGDVRCGWIIADESVIRRVRQAADYVSGGTAYPTQKIGLVALKKSDVILARTKAITQRNFKIVAEWLKKRDDLRWCEPEGGTVCLIKLPPMMDSVAISNHLREKYSTLVVPGDFFDLRGFLRVSCGVDEETLRTGLKNLSSGLHDLQQAKR